MGVGTAFHATYPVNSMYQPTKESRWPSKTGVDVCGSAANAAPLVRVYTSCQMTAKPMENTVRCVS